MTRAHLACVPAILALLLALAWPGAGITHASSLTLVVTTGNDPASCPDASGLSLRCAVQQANASSAGSVLIAFNVPSSDATCAQYDITTAHATVSQCTTELEQDLDPITHDNVTIDGYTQAGARLNDHAFGAVDDAVIPMQFDCDNANTGLELDGNNIVVRGISVTGCPQGGIDAEGNNAVIKGNFIGTDPESDMGQGNGFVPDGSGPDFVAGDNIDVNGDGATVGGLLPADRNVVVGSPQAGVYVSFSSNTTILGNYIGVAPDGQTANGNNPGITLRGVDNATVGGDVPGAANLIANNNGQGIEVFNGTTSGLIEGNVIKDQLGDGISVGEDTQSNDVIAIRKNLILNSEELGIDLGDDLTSECASPSPNGPNGLLPCPVIDPFSNITMITGHACAGCTVDVFGTGPTPNPSGYGEAPTYLGSVVAGVDCYSNPCPDSTTWVLPLGPTTLQPGAIITATATTPASAGKASATSEFAANVTLGLPVPGSTSVSAPATSAPETTECNQFGDGGEWTTNCSQWTSGSWSSGQGGTPHWP